MRQTAWTIVVLSASRLLAAEPSLGEYVRPEAQPFAPSPSLLLLRTIASLALVVGLILATAWLARLRGGLAAPQAAGRVRVIESATLGQNRSLHLVGVGQRVLLLGGGSQVTCLATFTAAEVGWDPDARETGFDSFLSRLQWPGRETPDVHAVGE